MNIRKWVKLAMLFSAAVIMAVAVPFTLSYVFGKTQPVVNTFKPPAGLNDENSVEILVEKTVVNVGEDAITPEGFIFLLENEQTGEILTAVANKDGDARFVLPFTGVDADGEHTYVLTEQNDGQKGVEYDTAKYEIRVEITLTDGKPLAAVYLDGEQVEKAVCAFENKYEGEEVPSTGDEVPLMASVLALICSGVLLILLGKKRKA